MARKKTRPDSRRVVLEETVSPASTRAGAIFCRGRRGGIDTGQRVPSASSRVLAVNTRWAIAARSAALAPRTRAATAVDSWP